MEIEKQKEGKFNHDLARGGTDEEEFETKIPTKETTLEQEQEQQHIPLQQTEYLKISKNEIELSSPRVPFYFLKVVALEMLQDENVKRFLGIDDKQKNNHTPNYTS